MEHLKCTGCGGGEPEGLTVDGLCFKCDVEDADGDLSVEQFSTLLALTRASDAGDN